MNRKIYDIGGARFYLKEDFTLEESELIQDLIQGIYDEGGNSSAGVRKFLSLVLLPVDRGINNSAFNFGRAKESSVREIIKDFFLSRLKSAAAMTDYLNSLMKEFSMPLKG